MPRADLPAVTKDDWRAWEHWRPEFSADRLASAAATAIERRGRRRQMGCGGHGDGGGERGEHDAHGEHGAHGGHDARGERGAHGGHDARGERGEYDAYGARCAAHPSLRPLTHVRTADLACAVANLKTPWGGALLAALCSRIDPYVDADEGWLARMIGRVTPGGVIFTMCPACEAAPFHGEWTWTPTDPERIVCRGCGATFPNSAFPECVTLRSAWDPEQAFTFHERHWAAFGFPALHSSFSGHIRARKVEFMADLCQDLAVAHALTGRASYGRLAARILLRFSEVYPSYLVHSGYGEYVDAPPTEGIKDVHRESVVKLSPPGNRDDGRIFPGFWMLGRATSGGMEGAFLHKVAWAYDLIASAASYGRPLGNDVGDGEGGVDGVNRVDGSAPLLTPDEMAQIERSLLQEGARFMVYDPRLNNKTTTNRSAALMLGALLGRRDLALWGLSGFVRAVCEWHEADGASGESAGYNLMVWHGLWRAPELMRHGLPHIGLPAVNFYDWPRFRAVLCGLTRPLLPGSLDSVHWGDTTWPSHLSPLLAHWIAARLPSARHSRLAALARAVRPDPPEGSLARFWYGSYVAEAPLFFAPWAASVPTAAGSRRAESTALEMAVDAPAALECATAEGEVEAEAKAEGDVLFPHLGQGYVRDESRRSCVMLAASPWGGHRQKDALNLTYQVGTHELLSDLGYLWDTPHREKVVRTFAHHTVMIDGEEQRTAGRTGRFHLFHRMGSVKVMQAEAAVYEAAREYVRTLCVVESPLGEYVLDLFRVAGGTRQEWVTHGPSAGGSLFGLRRDPQDGGAERPLSERDAPGTREMPDGREAPQAYAPSEANWGMAWPQGGDQAFWLIVPRQNERVALLQGWGARTRLADTLSSLDYLVRGRVGDAGQSANRFIALWHLSASCQTGAPPLSLSFVAHSEGIVARVAPAGAAGDAWEDLFFISDAAGAPPVALSASSIGGAVDGSGRFAFMRSRRDLGAVRVSEASILGSGALSWPGAAVQSGADVQLDVDAHSVTSDGCRLRVTAYGNVGETLRSLADCGHCEIEFAAGNNRLYPVVGVEVEAVASAHHGGAGGYKTVSGDGDAATLSLWTRRGAVGFDVVEASAPVRLRAPATKRYSS